MIGEAEMNRLRKKTSFTTEELSKLIYHRQMLTNDWCQATNTKFRVWLPDSMIIEDIDKLREELEPFIPTVYPVDDPRACKGPIREFTH